MNKLKGLVKTLKTEQMLKEVIERRRQWQTTRDSDFDWLIKQAEKVERYEKALTKITTRKMDTYLSTSHMSNDFIKTAYNALNNVQE